MKHVLDSAYWVNTAGVTLDPSNGEMSMGHIINTIAYLQKPSTINRLQIDERVAGEGYVRYVRGICLSCMSSDKYFEKRVKTSLIWEALCKGLTRYEER